MAGLAVGFGDVDFDVGFYAKFSDVAFCIADDGGRETHTPSVGQFAGERQPAAAPGGIAHDGDVGQLLHN